MITIFVHMDLGGLEKKKKKVQTYQVFKNLE